MKKKITAIFLCVALVAIAIVGASLAYFTDTKTATNTFTMGDVKIVLDETDVTKPTGPRVTSNTYDTYPGAVVTKDPIVHNTGKNAAWIRAKVEVKDWATNCTKYPTNADGKMEMEKTLANLLTTGLGTGWSVVDVKPVGNDVTFVLMYADKLAVGADTTAMFTKVNVPAGLQNGQEFGTIKVTAEAIQTDSFDTWTAAFAAFDGK